ncbi:MAG: ATP-binding cassette domain-containing protein [Singulisphaera sp.]
MRGVSLRFVSYFDKQYSMKRAVLDLLLRRESPAPASEFWALRDVDLRIGKGERIGIVGPNGAGKSTLLRLLARIYPPTAGTISVQGTVAPLIEMGAGSIPSCRATTTSSSTARCSASAAARCSEDGRHLRVHRAPGVRRLPLKYYSSGMYMRLAFAIATEIDPRSS